MELLRADSQVMRSKFRFRFWFAFGMALVRDLLSVFYWPSWARAARSGASEIRINPSNGVYISKISRIAPEAERADTKIVAMRVPLGAARSPQMTNVTVSQKTITTNSGLDTDIAPCSMQSQALAMTVNLAQTRWLRAGSKREAPERFFDDN